MASEIKRHIVAKAEELEPGHRKIIRLGNREIGVFNIDGDLYGLRNVVPMEFGYGHERENEILKCPWHQWEFDIKTGISITDPDIRVRSYRVEREGDDIVLYE